MRQKNSENRKFLQAVPKKNFKRRKGETSNKWRNGETYGGYLIGPSLRGFKSYCDGCFGYFAFNFIKRLK